MKFFAALKSADFAAKLASAAGFDFETALAAGNANALKAFIDEAIAKAAKPSTDAAAQVETLNAALESATAENSKLASANFVLAGTLTATGISFPAAAAAATTDEQIAANKAALDAFIKVRAAAILAQTGHPAITDVPGAGVPALTGRELLESRIAASLAKIKAARG